MEYLKFNDPVIHAALKKQDDQFQEKFSEYKKFVRKKKRFPLGYIDPYGWKEVHYHVWRRTVQQTGLERHQHILNEFDTKMQKHFDFMKKIKKLFMPWRKDI